MISPRRGTILIIVAGLCGLLASLAIAFVMRMRGDIEDGTIVLKHAQARIMLIAACQYILEAGRVGVRESSGSTYGEGFGWVDTRDGFMGPRGPNDLASSGDREALRAAATTASRNQLVAGNTAVFPPTNPRIPATNWPIGRAGRFPMYAWTRPPSAVSARLPNPISADPASADFGWPLLRNPDPVAWGTKPGDLASTRLTLAEWKAGDPAPLPGTQNLAWFRVLRDGPATFTITCGTGSSAGFRDWTEVDTANRRDLFGNDRRRFEDAVAAEVRLWYRIEWSAAIAAGTRDTYETRLQFMQSQSLQKNALSAGGSVLWIQRLLTPPTFW